MSDKTIPNPENFLEITGVLFQINKTILNPMGYSLSLVVTTKDEEKDYKLELFKTDSPLGYMLHPEDFERGEGQWKAFCDENKQTVVTRMKSLGFITQEDASGS